MKKVGIRERRPRALKSKNRKAIREIKNASIGLVFFGGINTNNMGTTRHGMTRKIVGKDRETRGRKR